MKIMIEKSGTGIEKSGTGIEKSGTGIERSGTGQKLRYLVAAIGLTTALCATTGVMADDSRLLISNQSDHLMITLHGSDGVIVGAATNSSALRGYRLIPLFSALSFSSSGPLLQPLVVATGSGGAPEVVATGSGGAKEVVATGSGGATQVVATGSGGLPQVVATGSGGASQVVATGSGGASQIFISCPDGGVQVVATGSGGVGEVVATGSGGAKEVVATGSGGIGEVVATGSGGSPQVVATGSGGASQVVATGSGGASQVVATGSGGADQSAGGCGIQPWGFAEVVSDRNGMHVLIHKLGPAGMQEYLVGFVSVPSASLPGSGRFEPEDGTWAHDFLAIP